MVDFLESWCTHINCTVHWLPLFMFVGQPKHPLGTLVPTHKWLQNYGMPLRNLSSLRETCFVKNSNLQMLVRWCLFDLKVD